MVLNDRKKRMSFGWMVVIVLAVGYLVGKEVAFIHNAQDKAPSTENQNI